ncbi:MAG: dihydrofolate reductase [Rhizobiales bacterium]|nr:dihydrofolate reductase [Hyphomicrobiales bacterium]
MGRLSVFNQVTVDGYFADAGGDMSWAKASRDAEFDAFVAGNASGGGTLLFGRVTYEMMAAYWPTPFAAADFPVVAARMNAMPKVVFSRTLARADWNGTRLVADDLVGEVRRLKAGPDDIAVLGSGSLVVQLAEAGLVDAFEIVVFPLVLGSGRTMFDGLNRRIHFRTTEVRRFRNGCILQRYEPVAG